MFRRLFLLIGSRRLSHYLLIAFPCYFAWLILLWILNLRPPAPYMVWGPFTLLAVLFLVNLGISLTTRKYAYRGNLIFHFAFILFAAGVIVSLIFRFSGQFILMDGGTFFGEKKDYLQYSSYRAFERSAPQISFKVDKIIPEYWDNRLYFTRLDAEVKFPAETMENRGIIKLNGGLKIDGANLRIAAYGIYPDLIIESQGTLVGKGPIPMSTFPPGQEDFIVLDNYKLYLKVLTEPEVVKGRVRNATMNINDPAFHVRVESLGLTQLEGIVPVGGVIKFGNFAVKLAGVKQWVIFGVEKDPGETIIFSSFIVGLAGLILRLWPIVKYKA